MNSYTLTNCSHADIVNQVATQMPNNGWTVLRSGSVATGVELIASHVCHGTERFFGLETVGDTDGHANNAWILASGHGSYDPAKTRFNQPGRPVGVYIDEVDYFNTDAVANVNATLNNRAVIYLDPNYCYIFIEVVKGCWESILLGGCELLAPRQANSADSDKSGQFYMGRPFYHNRYIETAGASAKFPWYNSDPDSISNPPSWANALKELGHLANGHGVKNGTGAYGGLFINRGTANIDWAAQDRVGTSVDAVYNALCLPQAGNNLRPMLPIEIRAKVSSWYVAGYMRDLRIVNGISVRPHDETVVHEATSWLLYPLPLFNRYGKYFEQDNDSFMSAKDNLSAMPCLAMKIV